MKLFLPFFALIKQPIRYFKVRNLQFFGKGMSFFLDHCPTSRYIWLLCKANHLNRDLSIFSYWQPRNFLVLGALSSSAWKNFSLFLIQVEMVFLGTQNLSAASLFVMSFSMCHKVSHFSSIVFVFSLRLNKKNRFFSFTVEIFV